MGNTYSGAAEFLRVHEYKHVQRWADESTRGRR